MVILETEDAVNLVKINRDVGRDAVLVLPNNEIIPNPIVPIAI